MHKTTDKINQLGRSMVEMLGVLAIVAVLSIAALAGYEAAITSLYTTQTIDRLTRRAQNVSTAIVTGQTPDLSEFNPLDGRYVIDSLNIVDEEVFSLTVHDVPTSICKKLLDTQWDYGWVDENISCEGAQDILVYFQHDLGGAVADLVPDQAVCTGTKCGGVCCPNNAQCINDKCVCPDDAPEYYRGKCLVPCREDQTRDILGNCQCPDGYFDFNSADKCISCDTPDIITTTREACEACERKRAYIHNRCYLAPNCSGSEYVTDKQNTYTTFSAETPQLQCISCEQNDKYEYFYSSDFASCKLCGNRYMSGSSCHPCSFEGGHVYTSEASALEQCGNLCNNRAVWEINSPASWAKVICGNCDDNKRFDDAKDQAAACATCNKKRPNSRVMINGDCVLNCPKNGMIFDSSKKKCVDCSTSSVTTVDAATCLNSVCATKRFPKSSGTTCYSCEKNSAVETTQAYCNNCSNRQYANGKCYLKNCPKDTFRQADMMSCAECDGGSETEASQEQCALCTQSDTRFFGTQNGKDYCFSCWVFKTVVTTQAECARCTDRTWTATEGNLGNCASN